MTIIASRFRPAVIVGLAVFLVLTGTGLAQALWTASSTHTTTVAAGRITATLDGPGLTAEDISSSAWSAPTALVLTNTSAVDVNYALAFTTTGTLDPSRMQVALWPRTGATCPTTPPGTASSSTIRTPTLPTGLTTAAPGTSTVVCAATRVSGELSGTAGRTLTATPILTATYAATTWAATIRGAAFTHTMASAPAAPKVTCTDWNEWYFLGWRPRGVRLTWNEVPRATGGYKAPTPSSTPGTTRTLELTDVALSGSVSVTSVGPTGDSAPAQVSTHDERTTWYGRVLRCGTS